MSHPDSSIDVSPSCGPRRQNQVPSRTTRRTHGGAPSAKLGALSFEPHEVVFAIADISGYTNFVVSHQKALAHGQMIVAEILRTLVDAARPPMELSRLEGDAVFVYLLKDRLGGPDEVRTALDRWVRDTFTAFDRTVHALANEAICKCPACVRIDDLRLKVVVHSGRALLTDIGQTKEFAGVDVIVVHRLLKNSVARRDYLLLTDSSKADLAPDDSLPLEPGEESYEGLGRIRTWVAPADALLTGTVRDDPTERASALAYEVLRHEIRKEYAEVANEPTKGFHFHTGRALADRLGYTEEEMGSVPASALESFAGTGNPFSLGEVPPGAKVVDVGCGAGFDTFLAANRVGSQGHVIGVDMTPEMLAKARAGVAAGRYDHVEIRAGLAEHLPVPNAWADLVISNGVINLCPDKPALFAEIHRVAVPVGVHSHNVIAPPHVKSVKALQGAAPSASMWKIMHQSVSGRSRTSSGSLPDQGGVANASRAKASPVTHLNRSCWRIVLPAVQYPVPGSKGTDPEFRNAISASVVGAT